MKRFFSFIFIFALVLACIQLPAQAAWQQKADGWYYTDSSNKPVTGWFKDGNSWYFFNSKGVMQTGWLRQGNIWYYLNASGAMVTGWQQISGRWYFFNGSGIMQTGWLQQGNIWYYLNVSGAMDTGWQQISGKWYFFNGSGIMQTGWLRQGNIWYYLNASGAMVTGWLRQGSIWYYMNTSGAMQTGWVSVGVDKYYFNSSGAMVSNTIVDDILLGQNGKAVQSYMTKRYGDYIGIWESTTEFHYMNITIEGGIMYLEYTCFSANASKMATAYASVILSDIENDQATFYYSDDGRGNSGTLVMDFSQTGQISCTATVTYQAPDSLWCIVPGTRSFKQ